MPDSMPFQPMVPDAPDAAPRAAARGRPLQRRSLVGLGLAGLGLSALGGCATLGQLGVQVRSYGSWPSGRAPGTYAFDRLPSQQAAPEQQRRLEDAAAAALAAAGFRPADAGQTPEVLVQLGVAVDRSTPAPWDDPLWWHGSGLWRLHSWRGAYWSSRFYLESPRFERQVAVLLRDRATGQPLYEAQAMTEGFARDPSPLLAPMFKAALQGFPAAQPELRSVRVPYSG